MNTTTKCTSQPQQSFRFNLKKNIQFNLNKIRHGEHASSKKYQHTPSMVVNLHWLGVDKLFPIIIIIMKTSDSYKFCDTEYWATYVEVLFSW